MADNEETVSTIFGNLPKAWVNEMAKLADQQFQAQKSTFMDRERFFQDILKHATFNRNDVQIFAPSLPARLKHEPIRRYIMDNDILWRVERIEGDSIFCHEATNQELADIQEELKEQA